MRTRRRRRRWAWPLLAALALVAGLIGLGLQVDPDRFRGGAVDAVSAWLDEPVTLGGQIDFRFLDGPELVLPDLVVGDNILAAREARIAVRFWPLLIGRFEPRHITLVEPQIDLLTIGAWRKFAGGWPNLPFERLEIVDGALEGMDGLMVRRVTATIIPQSPSGPFDIRGSGALANQLDLRLDATLGRLEPGRPASVTAKVTGAGAELALSGAVSRGPDGLELAGPMKLTSADPGRMLGPIGVAAPVSGALTVDAKLAWGGGRLRLSDLTLAAEGLRAIGGLDISDNLRVGEARLDFSALELEPWLPVLSGFTRGLAGRDLSLVLTADALTLHGGRVRQARVDLRLLDGQMTLRELSALLPGGTELTGFGRVTSSGGRPVYEGEVDLASDNLRLALSWLGFDIGEIDPGRLRRAVLSARLGFDGTRLSATSFDLKLDTSRMVGSGSLVLGAPPRFDLRLVLDRMTLDPYLPLLASGLGGGLDGAVALSADLVTWRGIPLRDFDLDLQLDGPNAELRRLHVGEVAGGELSVAGRIARGAGGVADLSFDIVTRKPSELLRAAGAVDGSVLPEGEVLAVAARMQGSLDRLALTGAAHAAREDVLLDGMLDLVGPEAPRFTPGAVLDAALRRLGEAAR
jgi:hypothetical protein